MERRQARRLRIAALALFIGAGSACDDEEAGLRPIPETVPLRPVSTTVRLQAAANADTFFLRLRWRSNEGTRQEYFHRTGGVWRRAGGGFRAPAASAPPSSETVLSVALTEPGSPSGARAFDREGCFLACHDRQTDMPNWRPSDGRVPMALFPSFGGIADLWAWRAHRTAPAGVTDDLSLGVGGLAGDPGTAAWRDLELQDGEPPFVFDPSSSGGIFARPVAAILTSAPFAFQDGSLVGPRAISLDDARARGYAPADDDTVPAQLLMRPSGSRADVSAQASYTDGAWDLWLSRSLATADAANDVSLAPGRSFSLALALHSDQAASRDHYVSLPFALRIGEGTAAIVAAVVTGSGPAATPGFEDETRFRVVEVPLFLPGLTSFDYLVGAIFDRDGRRRADDVTHGGRLEVASTSQGCGDCHAVRSTEPPGGQARALERLVLRRGGVFGATPRFESIP